MSAREIITDWTTPAGGGFASVMFFDSATSVASQRTALGAFWGSVDASLNNGVSWAVRSSGRELNEGSGVLESLWSDSPAQVGVGAGTVSAVADSTQVLFQWRTNAIVAGSLVRGRTFVPGLEISAVDDGNLGNAFANNFETYGDTLISADVGFSVWHRPIAGSGGDLHTVDSVTVWRELAVLRRRRK